MRGKSLDLAGRVAANTGCRIATQFFSVRIERGAGRVAVPRVPYVVDPALAALAPYRHIVLVGAREPVAFFAYPGKPGTMLPPGCEVLAVKAGLSGGGGIGASRNGPGRVLCFTASFIKAPSG